MDDAPVSGGSMEQGGGMEGAEIQGTVRRQGYQTGLIRSWPNLNLINDTSSFYIVYRNPVISMYSMFNFGTISATQGA